jgi:phenylacetate-CoA ligase
MIDPGGKAVEPRSAILAAQEAALRHTVAELRANPFWRPRLASLPPASELTVAEFQRLVPLLSKPEIVADQAAHPPYGTNLTYPLHRYTRCHQTSGTTGVPLRWLDTAESWGQLTEVWAEVLRAAGVGRGDRAFFAFSFGPFIGFWLAFEAAERLGALCVPGGGLSTAARLRTILDHACTVLCCTPTYALRLAETAHEEGISLRDSQVRVIVVAGEPGGSIPATRARIEACWPGASVFDHHGMTEVGPVTHQCPVQPGVLHVIEPAFLAEVIDSESGAPVAPGQTGELVLSTLHRHGTPLLRYRTGDLVRPRTDPRSTDAPPCACGRSTLALEGGILGRADDMFIVRGVNVFPSAVENTLRRFPEVAEFQVTVDEGQPMTEMRIRIEPGVGCADVGGLVRRVELAFQVALSLRVPVIAVPPGSLPRFEMKAKRWERQRSARAA